MSDSLRLGDLRRFLEGVRQDGPDGCWLWLRSWGFSRRGVSVSPARYAYETFVGPLPPGAHVLRRCGVPRCVNPTHLRPSAGRWRRTVACDGGHDHSTPGSTYISTNGGLYCRVCLPPLGS